MDGFGAYFGDNSLDTITKPNVPLTFITPQIKNPLGNVITDTLNWVPITGTFVANGTEKYMLIGNFLADDAVTTASINTPFFPDNWTDVMIDDASCIDINLPAYAGTDQPVIVGDSVYIGREPDFAIDEACTWYQLPNGITPIDTASGLWVKPVITTTYVVKQEIYCGTTKWDTVVVYMTAVGIKNNNAIENQIKIFPNPAQDQLQVEVMGGNEFNLAFIYNSMGQLLREEEISFKDKAAVIKTDQITNGVYFLRLSGIKQAFFRRFAVAK